MKSSIILAALLAGCATQVVPEAEMRPPAKVQPSVRVTPAAGDGTIVVKRDSGQLGAACTHHIWLDGQQVVSLEEGQGIALAVPAGEHVLSMKTGGWLCGNINREVGFSIAAGQKKSFRSGVAGDLAFLQATAF